MVRLLLAPLVIAYLPGALIFRLPIADRSRRASLAAEERVFWSIVISIVLSSVVVLALAAVGFYRFSRLISINSLVAAVLLVGWNWRLRFEGTAPRPGLTMLIPLVLVAAGFWMFFPPAEYVIGGKDPGVYINTGIQIAQRGALLVHDPVVSSVPPASRSLFFPWFPQQPYNSIRFMGFFVMDPAAGTVLSQFPHLYSAWIAIAYGVNGLSGARQVVGLWAILGLLAVYFASARVVGRAAAAAGAMLLAVNVIEVWFARYPNSEIVMQALLFTGLLAFARAYVGQDRFFAPYAAMLLGLALFTRFEAVLALVGIAGALALGSVEGRWPRRSFAFWLLVSLGLAGWYLTRLMTPYFAYPQGFIRELQPLHLAMIGAGGLALVGLVYGARRPAAVRRVQVVIPQLLVLAVLTGAAYAYFYRAHSQRVAPPDAGALRTFAAFYVTMPGLAAALLGFALTVRRAFWRDPALLLTATAFSWFFFYKLRIVPEHFWLARRFLPMILPMTLVLAAAAALFRLRTQSVVESGRWRYLGSRALSGLIGVGFLSLLGWSYVQASRPILRHIEYAGVIPRLEQLTERFGDRDLVLVESRNSSDLHVLATPLAYIYARNVLVLTSPRPDKKQFLEFLIWAHTRYRQVFFMGGGGTDLLSKSIGVQAVGSERFQVPSTSRRAKATRRA